MASGHGVARVAGRAALDAARRGARARPTSSYWDPFSPRANPELWTVAAFTALRRSCRDGATVHTYSGATATRTALLLAGFAVGFGDVLSPGTAGHGGGDAPTTTSRTPLDRRWLDRLSRSSAPFASDAPPDAFDRIARVAAVPRARASPRVSGRRGPCAAV